MHGHPAVERAADVDAARIAAIEAPGRIGFRVGRIQHVIAVDKQTARPAELRPGFDVVAVLVENLNPAIAAVADKQAPR